MYVTNEHMHILEDWSSEYPLSNAFAFDLCDEI